MATIASLVVSLAADISNFKDGMDKAGQHATGLKNIVQTGLGVALGGVLTKAADLAIDGMQRLVGVMTDAVNEAQKTELVNVKLEQALRNTGFQVVANVESANALAQRYRDLAGGEDDSVKSAEGVLLRFKEIGKDVFPQALQVSADLAAALGTDMPTASLMLGKALENPATGMRALKEAGVNFNAEELKVLETLMKTGRAADAQAIVMATLSGSVGGMAAAAANTMSGRWEIMNNHLADAAKGIAEKLLPIMERLFDQVIKPAIPVIEQIADQFGTGLANAINYVIGIVQFLGNVFAQNNNNMLNSQATTYTTMLNIAATVGTLLMQIWNESFFVKMMDQIFGVNLRFNDDFYWTFVYIKEWCNTIFGIIIPWRVRQVIDAVKEFPERVKEWFRTAGENVQTWLITAWDNIKKFFSWENLRQVGNNIIQGLSNGIQDGWMWLLNAINWVATNAVNAFKRAFGIASPSRVFHGFGVNMMEGLAQGIEAASDMPQIALNAAMPSAGMGVGGGNTTITRNTTLNYNASYSRPPASEPIPNFNMMRAMVSQ